MIEEVLKSIIYDLDKIKSRPKKSLADYINERLNSSLSVYYDELTKSVEHLAHKENLRMLRKMNKG